METAKVLGLRCFEQRNKKLKTNPAIWCTDTPRTQYRIALCTSVYNVPVHDIYSIISRKKPVLYSKPLLRLSSIDRTDSANAYRKIICDGPTSVAQEYSLPQKHTLIHQICTLEDRFVLKVYYTNLYKLVYMIGWCSLLR